MLNVETYYDLKISLIKNGIFTNEILWNKSLPNSYSVRIETDKVYFPGANGKGKDRIKALLSGYGEFIERLQNSTEHFINCFPEDFESFFMYPDEEFKEYSDVKYFTTEYMRKIYPDFVLDKRVLGNKRYPDKERILCLPFRNIFNKKKQLLPINLIFSMCTSNGMAQWKTKEGALIRAICEIFERYVVVEIIKNKCAMPTIPMDILEKYPEQLQNIKYMEEKGFKIEVKDASLGGKFPVISVFLYSKINNSVGLSFNSNPNFKVALNGAINELFQGRRIDDTDNFAMPSLDHDFAKNYFNMQDIFVYGTGVFPIECFKKTSDNFHIVDVKGTDKSKLEYILDIVKSISPELYYREYSFIAPYAVHVYIPGMSENLELMNITHNKAELEKSMELRKQLYDIFSDLLNIQKLDEKRYEHIYNFFSVSKLPDYIKLSDVLGLVFTDNCMWSDLNLNFFKLLLSIRLRKLSEARKNCRKYVKYLEKMNTPLEFVNYYKCLDFMIGMKMSNKNYKDYSIMLKKMFMGVDIQEVFILLDNYKDIFNYLETIIDENGNITFDSPILEKSTQLLNFLKKINILKKDQKEFC